MTKIAASLFTLFNVLALLACKSDPCPTINCSFNRPPPMADVNTCEAAVSGACGSQYEDLMNCEESNRVCNDETGTQAQCGSELAALEGCCATNSGAIACR
jgi:hypothetical protein